MNAAEVLDTVIDLYKKTFWRQMVRAMIFGVPAYIFLILYSLAVAIVFGASRGSPSVYAVAGFIAVFAVLFFIWEALSMAGNVSLVKQAYNGKASLDVMFKDIKASFFKVFTAVCAVFISAAPFICAAAFFLFRSVRAVSGADYWSFTPAVAYAAAAVVVVYLFTVAFEALTAAAVPVSVFEGKKFFLAVFKSVKIVGNDFFKVYGLIFIWRMIVLIINISFLFVFYIAAGSLNGAVNFFSENYSPAAFSLIIGNNFISVALTLLLSPFGGILASCVYISQRIKKEGFDIILKIENQGGRDI